MDTRLVGRVIEAARTVGPLLAVKATELDLKQLPANGNVRAQVAARLADGTFRVLIDGKALKLALPAEVKAGDVLQLRVVGREGDSASAYTNAGTAGKGVSTAGQLVAELVKQPSSTPPRQALPVVSVPPENPESLTAPLARAVERSGLFYESHQARWVNGEFPLERLLEEPQAQAGKSSDARSPLVALDASTAEPEQAAALPTTMRGQSDEAPEEVRPQSIATSRDTESEVAEKGKELVAREALPIVRQQLETLETRHFNWLGDIWPGQSMRWQIGEGPEDEVRGAGVEHEWDSRFTLDLPALGNVGAELVLVGNRLRIRLNAADETTAEMMREYSRELIHTLQAAGVEPLSIEVQHREPAL